MAIEFSLNQEGVTWRVKLTDCITKTPFSLTDVIDQFISFYKPDGTRIQKQGALVEDLPDNPGEFFIEYTNTSPEESILDLLDFWEYAGVAELVTTDEFQTSQRQVFWVVWLVVTIDDNKNIQRIIDRIKNYTPLYDEGATVGKVREVIFGKPVSKESIKQKPAIYVTTSDKIQNTRYNFGFSVPNSQNQQTLSYEITIVAAVKDQVVNAEKQLYDILKNLRDMVSLDPRFSDPAIPGTDQVFSRSALNDPTWDNKLKGGLINVVSIVLFATVGSSFTMNFPGIGDVLLLGKPNAPDGIVYSEDRMQKKVNRVLTENGDFGSCDVQYESTEALDAAFRAKYGIEEDVTLTSPTGVRVIHVKYININSTAQFDQIERSILHMEIVNA